MKNKNVPFLLITQGICSGTLIFDRNIASIPDWLAAILLTIALISFFIYIYRTTKQHLQRH